MTLRLYDTASRSVREFVPVRPGHCGIYLCGPTVQSTPHIGHLRSGLNYDVLRRWLLRNAYEVTFVQNVTDIDDKILARSAAAGVEWWALAYANELAYAEGYATLGCLAPTIAPRATGHVPEMIELMRELIDAGHGYPSGGDVYFAVTTFDGYGGLSGQRLDHMQPAADGPAEGNAVGDAGPGDQAGAKRDPRDFAMWKAHKPEEPATASWPTPWGAGRPGWHLECSAMAGRYLGDTFDIHGGGLDLVFPHHENELAQSVAAGRRFANYWVHHGLLNLGGEKMSKSVGNVIGLPHVLSVARPVELRYYLTAPHYRSTIDYSEESLAEAASAYRRIENFVQRATERLGATADASRGILCAEFAAAMDDDLGTPKAVAAVHDTVREGNAALAAGDDTAARGALASVRAMLDVLGLDPLSPRWSGGAASDLHGVVDGLVRVALEQRQLARARRDFAAADAVRDQLKHAGVLVEDTPDGPRWTIEGGP